MKKPAMKPVEKKVEPMTLAQTMLINLRMAEFDLNEASKEAVTAVRDVQRRAAQMGDTSTDWDLRFMKQAVETALEKRAAVEDKVKALCIYTRLAKVHADDCERMVITEKDGSLWALQSAMTAHGL